MALDTTSCYQAIVTHDRRFDGAFYVGVSSTRIYCRTVCTAKTPSERNCTFFASAAAAEQAGFRPCLRCRPELAPGNAKIDATSRLAAVIARRIEDGALSEMSLADLATELQISERHLRRVIEAEFGVTPTELAQTQRLLLAKQLLTDTSLPISEVAFASGFSSIRRFNAVFLERYNLNPSTIRKAKGDVQDVLVCQLSYRPPFDWEAMTSFLEARTAGDAERFIDGRYIRSVKIGNYSGWIEARPDREKSALQIIVAPSLSRVLLPLMTRIRRQFDLNADPQAISAHLGTLAAKRPGLRVPGAFDAFEIGVRAILGQQVSVKGATTLMKRLVTEYGEPIETPFDEINRLAPTPQQIAQLDANTLAATIRIPTTRAHAIVTLAKAIRDKTINLESSLDAEQTINDLKALPGIGDWTAHYIAMRVLNWPDAFPHGDLGIRKALKQDSSRTILELAEEWRPWRAYAAMHLWKSLED